MSLGLGAGPALSGGDPAGLRAQAARLEQAAAAVAGLAVDFGVESRGVRDRAAWSGEAAERYSARVGAISARLEQLAPPLRGTAAALRAYASGLEEAQTAARAAEAAAQAATQLPPIAQQAGLQLAQDMSGQAVSVAAGAAAAAATQIGRAVAEMPRFLDLAPTVSSAGSGSQRPDRRLDADPCHQGGWINPGCQPRGRYQPSLEAEAAYAIAGRVVSAERLADSMNLLGNLAASTGDPEATINAIEASAASRAEEVAAAAEEAGLVARTEAQVLAEKLSLDEARAGAGRRIMQGRINDSQYPEDVWAKMQHVHQHLDGTRTVIHYWENLLTGVRKGFKFL
ncbi:MAG: hypothetical protein M3024_04425 [Candidatus Dormibacteraeota bacterium]|nr:hypothetical protein [Candidatus Dormibacteraeota bacterium]MDQ6900272.1 hypothetical protein [Candidatus Dormibacteraeota bacterium]